MSPWITWYVVAHWLVALLTAFAVASWVSWAWKQQSPPWMARLITNPQRFWLAIAFGVLPAIFSMLLRQPMMWLYLSPRWSFAQAPVSFLMSVIYGFFYGIAASCCAGPPGEGKPFSRCRIFGISAALILVPSLFSWWRGFLPLLYLATHTAAVIAVLVVARSMIGDRKTPPASAAEKPASRPLGLALIIGFMPSALLLGAVAIASATNLPKTDANSLLWFCSVVSVVCCFVSSGMLFSRKTGGAIAGAILLMLLNAFIAFFFGCCASLNF